MSIHHMDVSTRSTDGMLDSNDDNEFMSITLSTLSKNKKNQELNHYGYDSSETKALEEDDNDTDRSSSRNNQQKASGSNFQHLVSRQHLNKLNNQNKHQSSANALQSLSSNSSEDGCDDDKATTIDATIGKKRYQLWEGKNKFLLGGRIMMGVHSKHLALTTVLLIGTNACYLFLLVPLVNRPALFETGLVIGTLNLIFLFLTAFTDPGIIPRRPPSKLLENMSADAREKMQYCHTCRIVRPPRAKHCRYCDNCVEVFDHHCPWTGTCIGVRNYRFFCVFVILTSLSSALCCTTSMYLIVLWAEGLDKRVGALMYIRDVVAPLLSTWTLMVFCLVGALLVFHLFLMSRSQTTNEFLRGVRPVNRKPTGCCTHVFGAIPPSKLLPMHEARTESDDMHDSNAVAHALSSLRSAIEENA